MYLSLIIGFIINENTTGGAIVDYSNQLLAVDAFSENLVFSLLN